MKWKGYLRFVGRGVEDGDVFGDTVVWCTIWNMKKRKLIIGWSNIRGMWTMQAEEWMEERRGENGRKKRKLQFPLYEWLLFLWSFGHGAFRVLVKDAMTHDDPQIENWYHQPTELVESISRRPTKTQTVLICELFRMNIIFCHPRRPTMIHEDRQIHSRRPIFFTGE